MEEDQHVIKILELNQAHIASMEEKIMVKPRLLSNTAGQSSCCIFRVPQTQIQIDRHAYHPHIISIGPYHYGQNQLQMIQEHKWRFLGSLLSRTQNKGLVLEDYFRAVKSMEDRARECYSEVINLNSDEFVEMLVLDGCFIVELFRIVCGVVKTDPNDPIFALSWVFHFLLRDFVKLENQIPFFILQALFDLSKLPEEENATSLVALALKSFDHVVDRPEEVIKQFRSQDEKHLLDLLRSSFIPLPRTEKPRKPNSSTDVIECVSKLRRAGIKFKLLHDHSFLNIQYRNGVIEMPCVSIDDFTGCFFFNCVAFEQCYKHRSKHMTTYATLMDCLMNTYRDVEFLCDAGIVENYLGTDGEVSRFFNTLGRDMAFDVNKCYLAGLFEDVNGYYRNKFHVQLAGFKYTYFRTPWSFISALAAVVLLLLTVAQTVFTVYSYYRQ